MCRCFYCLLPATAYPYLSRCGVTRDSLTIARALATEQQRSISQFQSWAQTKGLKKTQIESVL